MHCSKFVVLFQKILFIFYRQQRGQSRTEIGGDNPCYQQLYPKSAPCLAGYFRVARHAGMTESGSPEEVTLSVVFPLPLAFISGAEVGRPSL